MPSQNTKRHILIILFIQPVIWSFSNSLPAKGDKLVAPWDWDDFTWYPRYTTPRPYIRFRYTLPPDDEPRTHSSFPLPVFYIFMGVVLFVSLVVILIKCACATNSDVYDSSPILHRPPANIIRPPERIMQPPPPQNVSNWGTPIGGGLFDYPPNTNLGGGVPNYPAPTMPSSAYSAGDKPPDYSEVVISDFVDENKKFIEVVPKSLDTPPPSYEDGSLRRY